MSDKKLLTILIPVYNGAKYISGLLHSFANFVETGDGRQQFVDDCEILVIDNRSTDSTFAIAKSFEDRILNLRVEIPATHVPTAEENVFRSFKRCNGEYTWVLGCDDIVRFEAIGEVIEVAREGKHDLAIFNFMQSDKDGGMETVCNYFMKEREFSGALVDFTQRMGFWWLIAGFSGQIVRTSRVASFDHAGLVAKTSPIYSHVTAYLECLAKGSAAIINVQNVVYRLSDNDPDHWKRAAGLLDVFDEYFWTLGYIRQIKYLENRGIVGSDYLIKMIESNRNGFFRPTIVIYDKLVSQLQLMETLRNRRGDRNRVKRSEFDEVVAFFEQRDLLARPFLSSLRDLYDAVCTGQATDQFLFEQTQARLQSYRSTFLLTPAFVGIYSDYEIYEVSKTFYAVHRFFRNALLDVVRYLDPTEQSPIVFTGSSRAHIADRIKQDGIGLAWDDVPQSLMRYWSQPATHTTLAVGENRSAVSTFTHQVTPQAQVTALQTVQRELKSIYRSRRSRFARMTAWLTMLGLKTAKSTLQIRSVPVSEVPRA